MVVSFKISKTGRRVVPNLSQQGSVAESEENPNGSSAGETPEKVKISDPKTLSISSILSSIISEQRISSDYEVSFTLNLLPDGFFIGKPGEGVKVHNPLQDGQRLLHPYNKASETFFAAIKMGCLPGDILDDMPSKFYNGAIVCEVCDFRNCGFEGGSISNAIPLVKKVLLRMSLENIVKDIPSITDETWTYGDLMEIESRVLKVLQPKIFLDPRPMLDRLCREPVSNELKLDISRSKRKGRLGADVTILPNNQMRGKKICIEKVTDDVIHEFSDLENVSKHQYVQSVNENPNLQHISSATQNLRSKSLAAEVSFPNMPLSPQSQSQPSGDQPRGHDSLSRGSPSVPMLSSQIPSQNLSTLYTNNIASGIHGKRDTQDVLPINVANKRSKHAPSPGHDGNKPNQQLSALQVDGMNGAEMWKNTMLQQQIDPKGKQYPSDIMGHKPPLGGDSSNPEFANSFHPSEQLIRIGIKQEQIDSGSKMDRPDADQLKSPLQVPETEISQGISLQLRHHQLAPQIFQSRTQFTQQPLHEETRKEDMLQRRKLAPNSRVSAGMSAQTPVASRSSEFSAASLFGTQKEKATAISVSAVGTTTVASSSSVLQAPIGKGKRGSIAKISHTMNGVPSPASVSNISAPVGAGSPSIAVVSMSTDDVDPAILDRFSKIEMVTQRHQLNKKKTKTEAFNVKKSGNYSINEISALLSQPGIIEDFTDSSRMMSGSIFNGSINTCKTRIVKSVRVHSHQGPSGMLQSRTDKYNRLVMTERPSDGSVAMNYSDSMEDSDVSSHDCLFLLPNTLYADLLADQYVSLMRREGYQILEDQIQPISKCFVQACGNPFITMAMFSENITSEGQQPDVISGQQPSTAVTHIMNQQTPSQNNPKMSLPGSNNGLQMPHGSLQSGQTFAPARAQQLEPNLLQQQQQMQLSHQQQVQNQQSQIPQQSQAQMQLQRSPMLQMSPLSQFIGQNSNMQIGGVGKPSQFHLHAIHQVQQQQQAQFSKKSMMGMGPAAIGGMGNSVMGLSGLGNAMGIAGVRGLSSPMSPMTGLTGVTHNQMNLGSTTNFNVGFRPGSIPATHAAMFATKMRMAQNRGNLFGSQPGLTGLSGNTGQVSPNSMGVSILNQSLNRPAVNTLQRTVMSTMGPPKIPGQNIYIPPSLQQQLQHQHQLQQMQQEQQQFQQQQLQISSPLQQQSQVSSPSIVGPPSMSVSQITTQPLSQQTVSPQQMSAGAMQQMNNNNIIGPGPASPQLSSQTHGSIGSISSSPLEQLQGANKGSSMNTS